MSLVLQNIRTLQESDICCWECRLDTSTPTGIDRPSMSPEGPRRGVSQTATFGGGQVILAFLDHYPSEHVHRTAVKSLIRS